MHSNMLSCCESICALRSVRACMYEAEDSLDNSGDRLSLPPPALSRALFRLLDADEAVTLSGSGSERPGLTPSLDALGWLGVGARDACRVPAYSESGSKSLTSGVHNKSERSSPLGAMDIAIRSRSAWDGSASMSCLCSCSSWPGSAAMLLDTARPGRLSSSTSFSVVNIPLGPRVCCWPMRPRREGRG
jgi:hypothetical protein